MISGGGTPLKSISKATESSVQCSFMWRAATRYSVFWDRRHKRDFLFFSFLVWHFFCLVAARPKLEIRHFCKETNLQAWSICETACVCLLPWVCGSYATRTNIPIRNAQDLLLFMPRHPSHEPKGCKCFNTCLMVLCNKNTFIQC